MLLLGVRGRRRRSLLLGAVAVAWLVAAVGAFSANRVVLGIGVVLAGVAAIVALKLHGRSLVWYAGFNARNVRRYQTVALSIGRAHASASPPARRTGR